MAVGPSGSAPVDMSVRGGEDPVVMLDLPRLTPRRSLLLRRGLTTSGPFSRKYGAEPLYAGDVFAPLDR